MTKEIKNGTGHFKYEMQYESQEQEKLTASEKGFEPTENCY